MSNSLQAADWLSMQYDSFQRFFSKENPPPEISLQSIINEIKDRYPLPITGWDISAPPTASSECIITNQAFTSELSLSTNFQEEVQSGKQIIDIPSPTPDGEFILHSNGLKANRYVMVMEINQSPGIHYKIKETKSAVIRVLIIHDFRANTNKIAFKSDCPTHYTNEKLKSLPIGSCILR